MLEENQKEMSLLKTQIRNVEIQVGQVAQENHRRLPVGLPSDTVSTSKGKEQCNAVTLRSGKQLEEKSEKQELISNNLEGEIEESMLEQPPKGPELHNNLKESCSQENKAPQQPETSRAHEQSPEEQNQQPEKLKEGEKQKSVLKPKEDPMWNFPELRPPPPCPLRQKKAKLEDKEYKQFLEMMKSVNLSISAYELFTGTPKYAKFFKQMMSHKEVDTESEVITLSAKCSSLIKKDIKLPKKLKYPGSCNI